MILTGATAALYFGTLRLGRCRQIGLEVDREALPTTKQGDIDRTFISGLRDTKGSASLFYDPSDPAVEALLAKVFTDSGELSGVDLVFDTHTDEKVSVSVVLTNASINAGYGAAQVCDVQFQVSGKPATKFTDAPVVPPTPAPGPKWTAFSSINEIGVNSHNIELDDQGNTYSFIANTEHSEVTKFSPAGAALWSRRFTSYQSQADFFGSAKVGQTIHRVNDNLFVCIVGDKLDRTHYIGLDASGQVLFNKAYDLGGQFFRVLSPDGSRLLTSRYLSSGASTVNVFNTATNQLLRRFTFSNISNVPPWLLRNAIQKPSGNWVFYVTYEQIPGAGYLSYFIETNASMTSVSRAVRFADLDITSSFCYRPDTGGYFVLGSTTGRVHYLNDSFELVEARKFSGTPRNVLYDANGDYYFWTVSATWYQDIGAPWGGITLIKYNWNSDLVHYVTAVSGFGGPTVRLNSAVQRMSFTQQSVNLEGGGGTLPPYRMINSFNLVQPSATSGSPIATTNPPNFTFFSRSVLNPTPRPVSESLIHTRVEVSVSIVEATNAIERVPTFIVEPVTRSFSLVSSVP